MQNDGFLLVSDSVISISSPGGPSELIFRYVSVLFHVIAKLENLKSRLLETTAMSLRR